MPGSPLDGERFRRDLDWILGCPSLFDSGCALDLPDPNVEFDLEPIERFFETKASYRVGYYFESLIRVWLESLPEISHIEQSVVIRGETRTLGELDFLFRKDGQLHHLEVALKYYLHFPESNHSGSHFVGPNAADTFERKRDRLLGHQLPLGKQSRPEIAESSLLVRGMIFYHPDHPDSEELPARMNPNHRRGRWIRRSELERLETWQKGTILQKPYWLGPPTTAEAIPDLIGKIEAIDPTRPVMVSIGENGDGIYREHSRWFVVPVDWPVIAT